MWQPAIIRPLRLLALFIIAVVLAACAHHTRSDAVPASDTAAMSFDVTLVAEKDDQFDFQHVPLSAEDLRAALNYRKEQGQPMQTVLLKRGEKNRIKDSHIVGLARIAVALGFTAFIDNKGEIQKIDTSTMPGGDEPPHDASPRPESDDHQRHDRNRPETGGIP